ncbi:MAG: hypothetical protein IT210_10065 [Armatimonadetes bacterium]|nr:hypothetical protein [Armatimonadota bacterium]
MQIKPMSDPVHRGRLLACAGGVALCAGLLACAGVCRDAPRPRAPARPNRLSLDGSGGRAPHHPLNSPKAPVSRASATAEADYNRALESARSGSLTDALSDFRRIARLPEAASVRDAATGTDLRERAAYQAAICLSAAGRSREAIQALDALLSRTPSATILIGCRDYLAKLRGGRLTASEERWLARAQKKRQEEERARQWRLAACGPKALGYVLRSHAQPASWQTLAREAGMTRQGTSMDGLARCARQRGFSAVGVQVDLAQLTEQPPPASALPLCPNYVIAEQADRQKVQV